MPYTGESHITSPEFASDSDMTANAAILFNWALMSSSNALNDGVFWAIAGLALGGFLFFRGFQMLRYKRLILDTPASTIRGASMGLVEVSGMPVGPHTLQAPITGQPCYYYRACAWQKVEEGNKTQWKQVIDESMSVPFFIEDQTGRVLVNPAGAQLDVHRDFKDEFQTSFMRAEDMMPPSVKNFLVMRGVISDLGVRLEEYCILPGYPLYVFGTLGDNSVNSWTPTVHMSTLHSAAAGMFQLGFGTSGGAGKQVGGSFGRALGISAGNTIKPNVAVALGTRIQPAVPANTVDSHSSSAGAPGTTAARVNKWGDMMDELPASGSRATSVATMPSPIAVKAAPPAVSPASVPAPISARSDVPNPEAKYSPEPPAQNEWDLNTRIAIGKGEHRNPFMISSRSQREVVQSLAWKSTLYIWGGPVLALVALYFLL